MNAPCLNCEKRVENCHSNCTEYIKFTKEVDIIKQARMRDVEVDRYKVFRGNERFLAKHHGTFGKVYWNK